MKHANFIKSIFAAFVLCAAVGTLVGAGTVGGHSAEIMI